MDATRAPCRGFDDHGGFCVHTLNEGFGSDYSVHGLFAENLRYYAKGRFLGGWFGPYSFRKIEPLLRDPPRLCAGLQSFGTQYLLCAGEVHIPQMTQRGEDARHFSIVAQNDHAVVIRCLADEW
jgi:hypothetical protein